MEILFEIKKKNPNIFYSSDDLIPVILSIIQVLSDPVMQFMFVLAIMILHENTVALVHKPCE